MAVSDSRRVYKNPSACASAFGRIFWAVDSIIYFSQVIVSPGDVGRCYQTNDPTSSEIPDLLDTDGGVFELEDSRRIKAIRPYRAGILVFAGNGLWYVYNPDGGFKATAFNIHKVSERGLDSVRSIVEAEGAIYYFSNNGIMRVVANDFDNLAVEDITQSTIKSHYIDNLVALEAQGAYDEGSKQITWWVPNQENRGLILDTQVGAFYPQKNASDEWGVRNPFTIANTVYYPSAKTTSTLLQYSFARPKETTFKDFGVDQEAYLITGWETLGKFANKKNITQAKVYFNKTETEITGYTDGEYSFDRPSGCLFQARWDFDNSNAFKKHVGRTGTSGSGKEMQLYKPLQRGFIPTSYPFTFDTGESLISKKFNIRGNGDAVQFVFKAQPEKDLQLLGYSVSYTMRGRI